MHVIHHACADLKVMLSFFEILLVLLGQLTIQASSYNFLPDGEKCSNQEMEGILESTLFLGVVKFSLVNEVGNWNNYVSIVFGTHGSKCALPPLSFP